MANTQDRWQWQENNGSWIDFNAPTNAALNNVSSNGTYIHTYTAGNQQTYQADTRRMLQQNTNTTVSRRIRKLKGSAGAGKSWRCGICTMDNKPSDAICAVCHQGTNPNPTSSGQWACSICTYVGVGPVCGMCGSPNPNPAPMAVAPPPMVSNGPPPYPGGGGYGGFGMGNPFGSGGIGGLMGMLGGANPFMRAPHGAPPRPAANASGGSTFQDPIAISQKDKEEMKGQEKEAYTKCKWLKQLASARRSQDDMQSERTRTMVSEYLSAMEEESQDQAPEEETGRYDKHEDPENPLCVACMGSFNGIADDDEDEEECEPCPLPDNCGGPQFICNDCCHRHITTQINDGEVVPWVRSPAPDNNQHIPLKIILELCNVQELIDFAIVHLGKSLMRNSNWVACINNKYGPDEDQDCPLGFIVTGDGKKGKKKPCPHCGLQQMVSKNPEDNDPEYAKMLASGQIRKCPKCAFGTMKDKGICNVIQCSQCNIWWNWRSRGTGTNSRELKNKARRTGTLWEPGELAYQQNLERSDPEAFRALLEANGQEYNPNYVRGTR